MAAEFVSRYYGPNGAAVAAFLRWNASLQNLSILRRMARAMDEGGRSRAFIDAHWAAWDRALSDDLDQGTDLVHREIEGAWRELAATLDDNTRIQAQNAVEEAALALLVRDRITSKQYDTLIAPWASATGQSPDAIARADQTRQDTR